MDALTILNKLKEKRPELAEDPLFGDLEMSLGEEDDMGAEEPMDGEGAGSGEPSYLDEEAGPEGEMGAGGGDTSYLDQNEASENESPEEDNPEEEMAEMRPRKKSRMKSKMGRY